MLFQVAGHRVRIFQSLNMSFRYVYPMWVLLLFLQGPAQGATIYVDQAASGANSGASWADAYTNLQSALGAAVNGDEILVAQGLYKPAAPGASRTNTFFINKTLSLFGGFAGNETNVNQRDRISNVTVLSGELAGDDTTDVHGVVQDWPGVAGLDNCWDVVTEWTVTTTIDGFTITGGHADTNDTRCLPEQQAARTLQNLEKLAARCARLMIDLSIDERKAV